MTTHKKWRNKLYRACGILILLCVIGAGLQDKIDWPIGNYQTFKFELVALWAFGIAWMVKGELFWFLNDGE